MVDCVKLNTCWPASNFSLAVLYSLPGGNVGSALPPRPPPRPPRPAPSGAVAAGVGPPRAGAPCWANAATAENTAQAAATTRTILRPDNVEDCEIIILNGSLSAKI